MGKNKNKLFALLDKFDDRSVELSTKELHQIIFLLGSEREREDATQWIQQQWEKPTKVFNEVNYERISDLVKQRTKTTDKQRLSFMQILYRSAAILLLPFIGLSIYFFIQTINSNRFIQTEIVEILDSVGTQSRVILSDGTIATLKDGSQLCLRRDFLSGNTREVTLEGEAFFEIAHNPDKPFIIHTKGIKTTALGTAFIVRAVPDETSITVTVIEGKVKVEEGIKLLATLEANQQFIYGIEFNYLQEKTIEAEKIEAEKVETETETHWQPHELIFHNMPFGDIVQDLANRHGVSIVFENEVLKRLRIDALLDNRDSIDALLKFLCALQQATYTVQGNTYVIKPVK